MTPLPSSPSSVCSYCNRPMTGGDERDFLHKRGERFAHVACVRGQGREGSDDEIGRQSLRTRSERGRVRWIEKAGGSDDPTWGSGGVFEDEAVDNLLGWLQEEET